MAMNSTIRLVLISSIRIGDRSRTDMGDIHSLAESISSSTGLLHFPVVNTKMELISGARRIAAVKLLGWKEIRVHVVSTLNDAEAALQAERDENSCREPLKPSEVVALGQKLEKFLKPLAEKRMKSGVSEEPSGNLPEGQNGETREVISQITNMGARTYDKAKEVVTAAKSDPALKPIVKEMDKTGNVSAALRAVEAHQDKTKDEPILDATGYAVPKTLQSLWDRKDEVMQMLKSVAGIRNELAELQKAKDILFSVVDFTDAIMALDRAHMAIKNAQLWAVCTSCQGRMPERCTFCKGRGILSKFAWDSCVPSEVKSIRHKTK